MRRFALALVACLPVQALAQDGPQLAQAGLAPRIAYLESTGGAAFELGMLKSLRALEHGLQTRHDYGLGDRMTGFLFFRMSRMRQIAPPVKAATPDTIASIARDLIADLEDARAALAKAGPDDVVELAVDDLWFDINSDGTRDPSEAARPMLAQMLLGRRVPRGEGENAGAGLVIRFDRADQAWLAAYTHILSGAAEGLLAFDPTPVLTRLAEETARLDTMSELPAYYDQANLRMELEALKAEDERLSQEAKDLVAKSKPLNDRLRVLQQDLQKTKDRDQKARLDQEISALRDELDPINTANNRSRIAKRALRAEIDAIKAKMPPPDFGNETERQRQMRLAMAQRSTMQRMREPVTAFYVALAALKQQPDAGHVQAMRDHWLAMIAQNSVLWAEVAKETDNDREWIPNPSQTPALPIEVDARAGETWQKVLEEAEAVLQGRLLIPHPFLPDGTGISLAAWFDDPSPIDLMEWVQGIGSYAYVARGPRVGRQYWAQFGRMTGGRAGLFSLYFN